ncbi:hypothetical protein PTKIN_Ptkin19aG0069000 [Pterospermum kingtungense]
MSIWEYCELLNEYVDESDPDLDDPQIEHLLRSAEAIRKDYPHQDWLHLTALIYGDTFSLGCVFDESIVHHHFFKENPDNQNPDLNTKLGVYRENCELGKVSIYVMGPYDEYMYLVAKGNNTTLPPAAFFIISKYDLYSKSKVRINVDEVKPYYLSLIHKYRPEKLKW